MTHSKVLGTAAALLLSLPSLVFASSQQTDQQYRSSPAASTERFAGEISYQFDSALNRTTATYRARLGNRGLLHRIFFPPPTVYAITASYEFPGRAATQVLDSVRVVFESEEDIVPTSGNHFEVGDEHYITLGRGEDAVQRSGSVLQRIELDSSPLWLPERLTSIPRSPQFQLPQTKRAHVTRKATAVFSFCEFLPVTHERELHGTVGGVDFSLSAPKYWRV